MAFCIKCGTQVGDTDKFCGGCGAVQEHAAAGEGNSSSASEAPSGAAKAASGPKEWLNSLDNKWLKVSENDADIELYLRGLSWEKENQSRMLILNLTVPTVKNNIDLCLLNSSPKEVNSVKQAKEFYQNPNNYLAFGELKGGIDPAGADEHWKTARTALNRIQVAFSEFGLQPELFFIGAAIEKKMATEIWGMLENNQLANAANLTNEMQLTSIARWICNI